MLTPGPPRTSGAFLILMETLIDEGLLDDLDLQPTPILQGFLRRTAQDGPVDCAIEESPRLLTLRTNRSALAVWQVVLTAVVWVSPAAARDPVFFRRAFFESVRDEVVAQRRGVVTLGSPDAVRIQSEPYQGILPAWFMSPPTDPRVQPWRHVYGLPPSEQCWQNVPPDDPAANQTLPMDPPDVAAQTPPETPGMPPAVPSAEVPLVSRTPTDEPSDEPPLSTPQGRPRWVMPIVAAATIGATIGLLILTLTTSPPPATLPPDRRTRR